MPVEYKPIRRYRVKLRNIHEDLFAYESFCKLPHFIQLVFIGLVVHADDYGKIDGMAERLHARYFVLQQDVNVRKVEQAITSLGLLAWKDGYPILKRYMVGELPVIQLNEVLWADWSRHRYGRKKVSLFPDDPATIIEQNSMVEASATDIIASAPILVLEFSKFWNGLDRKPRASWTDRKLQESVYIACTPKTRYYMEIQGLGLRPNQIKQSMLRFHECTRSPMCKSKLMTATLTEFLLKHAKHCITDVSAREYCYERIPVLQHITEQQQYQNSHARNPISNDETTTETENIGELHNSIDGHGNGSGGEEVDRLVYPA